MGGRDSWLLQSNSISYSISYLPSQPVSLKHTHIHTYTHKHTHTDKTQKIASWGRFVPILPERNASLCLLTQSWSLLGDGEFSLHHLFDPTRRRMQTFAFCLVRFSFLCGANVSQKICSEMCWFCSVTLLNLQPRFLKKFPL